MPEIYRRTFLQDLAGLGAYGLPSVAGLTQAPRQAEPKRTASAGPLPARGEFVVRNAFVMTMDAASGDLSDADVHVRNGEIVGVGRQLHAPGARSLDGRGMIVLPGLVDTHWHMWNTLLRSFAGDQAKEGYFPTAEAFGKLMRPEDMYCGTILAAAEALHAGITTVHDWCHNARSPKHARADLRALEQAGIRARWSYGWAQGQPNSEPMNLADLERLQGQWKTHSQQGLLSLGMAWRGIFRFTRMPETVYRAEFETARRLGIPISVHVGASDSATGQVEAHAREGLLGRDVQLIHALSTSQEEIRMIAESGSTVSVSPGSELRIGYGFTRAADFIDAKITLGLSVDTTALSGSANLFETMKLLRNVENARTHNEFRLSARRVLELGTIEGARSLGLDKQVGSLTPGKRADMILVSTRNVNMAIFTNPANLVVEAAGPSDVDTVVVDGRILKRGGRLTALDPQQIAAEASAAFQWLRPKAGRL